MRPCLRTSHTTYIQFVPFIRELFAVADILNAAHSYSVPLKPLGPFRSFAFRKAEKHHNNYKQDIITAVNDRYNVNN